MTARILFLCLSVLVLISWFVAIPAYLRPVFIDQGETKTNFGSLDIILDTTEWQKISNLLVGFNVIYPHEKDKIWEDGTLIDYLKDINTSIIRYPGGTVTSFYHWNALTGNGWADSWDPENNLPDKQRSDFMDIDQYISLITETGATPLVGINMSSGWRWNRIEDGINEAIELMKYCRDKNFKVKYWYLDNEPYQHDSNGGEKTPEEYASLINQFAPRMKEFDPEIKIIANWNAGFKIKRDQYKILIAHAGSNIDIIDVHWYWAWQQSDQMGQWLARTPMVRWTQETYIEEIEEFRKFSAEMGYPEMKIASLEWNTGPDKDGNLKPAQSAMIQSEMLMQFIIGGLDMGAFWPIHWPESNQWGSRGLWNTATNTINPNYHLFRFFGQTQGASLLKDKSVSIVPNTLFFACIDEYKILRVAILNKNKYSVPSSIDTRLFSRLKNKGAQSFILADNGESGKLIRNKSLKVRSGKLKLNTPPLSLTMLTLEVDL